MAANTDAAARLYDRLGPAERTVLVLEARARRDETEADRLMSSCPWRSYRSMDAEFTERMNLAFDKMAACGIGLMHMAARLEALHAALGCVDGFAESYRLSASLAFFDGLTYAQDLSGAAEYVLAKAAEGVRGREASPAGPEDAPEPNLVEHVNKAIGRAEGATQALKELLSDGALSVAVSLLDMRAAFDRFCRQCVGVPAEVLWASWDFPPDLRETMTESLKPYEQLKPREEQVQAFYDAMSRAWLERFGPGVTFTPHDP